MRILWQERPVQIRTDHIFIKHTLCLILFIIAIAIEYPAQRLIVIDVRPASMILKPDNRKLQSLILNHDV